jgi:tetratricopeptide (TPR) repeat protein
MMGEAYYSDGQMDKAIATWKEALEDDQISELDYFPLSRRRASVLIELERYDEARVAMRRAQQDIDTLVPHVTPAARLQLRAQAARLWASLNVATGNHAEAITNLLQCIAAEKASGQTDEPAYLYSQLGSSYTQLEQWDLAAAAFERAAYFDPGKVDYVAFAGVAWERAGKLDTAIPKLQQAVMRGTTSQDASLALGRALRRRQLLMPEDQRDWRECLEAIEKAKASFPESLGIQILDAEVTYQRGNSEEAIKRLEELLANNPESLPVISLLLFCYEGSEQPENADRLVDTLAGQEGQATTALLYRASLLQRRAKDEEARNLLEEALASRKDIDRTMVARRLVAMHRIAGRIPEAKALSASVLNSAEMDFQTTLELCELEVQAGDIAALETHINRLQEFEGETGAWWRYYRAQRLLMEAKQVNDPRFIEAYNIQLELEKLRAFWPLTYELRGRLAEARGRFDDALQSYETAVNYGSLNAELYRSIIRLLTKSNRFDDASKYMARLRALAESTSDLEATGLAIEVAKGNIENAIAAAKKAVLDNPDDPKNHIWLGMILTMAEDYKEAEIQFRTAVLMAQDDPQTWLHLFGFFVISKNMDRALETLAELEEGTAVPANQQAFLLAQCYELIDRDEDAEAHYFEALRLNPKGFMVWRNAAAFFSSRDPEQTKECLARARELMPDTSAGREALVEALMAHGGANGRQESLALLEEQAKVGNLSPKEQRLLGLIRINDGSLTSMIESEERLAGMVETDMNVDPQVRVSLARLWESRGQLREAREQMLLLVSKGSPDPDHIEIYIDMILRHGEQFSAEKWIEKLADIEPDAFRTIMLRTRWLADAGREDEAVPLIEAWAEKQLQVEDQSKKKAAELHLLALLQTARLFAVAKDAVKTEQWYQKAVDKNSGSYREFADWLTTQDRNPEAVEIAFKHAKEERTVNSVIILCTILSRGKVSDELTNRCEQLIGEIREQYPQDIALLFAVGTMYQSQRSYEDAASIYEKILRKEPDHVITLNNLANVLIEIPDRRPAALEHVTHAIEIAGGNYDLMDTQALAFLAQGKAEEAIEILSRIAQRPPINPLYQLHLAAAYFEIGDKENARAALQRAESAKFDLESLSKYEEDLLTKLRRGLL